VHTGEAGATPRDWLETYFRQLKEARDRHALAHPERPYVIGVYGTGGVLEWGYRQGFVGAFWQSVSFGTAGNTYPSRPWCHTNRFQFNREQVLEHEGWNVVPGADPDMDWGDGGTWTLADPLAQQLFELEEDEKAAVAAQLQQFLPFWGGLLDVK
jgi:hypothetical protein